MSDTSSMDEPTIPKAGAVEKRKHRRYGVMGLVTLTVQGEEPQTAYLATIGRGGLGVYAHREIKANKLVVITLSLIEPGHEGEELKIAARIRWARPAGELYMAGLQFEKMSDQRYEALVRHLNVIEEMQP